MASHVLCGNCGSALPHPAAACPQCGAYPSGGTFRPPKNALAAAVLAIVPGLGHIYLGEHLKGAFFLLASGGLEFLGLDLDLTVLGAALGIPLGLGGIGLYAYQIWDAYREAKRLAAGL